MGKLLLGGMLYVKKIDRELKTINIDKLEDLEQLKDL